MQTLAIASAFCLRLRACLTAGQLASAIALNAAETNAGICHSHDNCDANIFMAEAFEAVIGRHIDLQDDADGQLWSDAWQLAKDSGFSL